MADVMIDVNWEIEAPRDSWPNIGEKRFDRHSAGDQGFGPEPESPPMPAPETDGRDMPGGAA